MWFRPSSVVRRVVEGALTLRPAPRAADVLAAFALVQKALLGRYATMDVAWRAVSQGTGEVPAERATPFLYVVFLILELNIKIHRAVFALILRVRL